jgi:hypothetical protein
MDAQQLRKEYFERLHFLFEKNLLNKKSLDHFQSRGIKVIDTLADLGCPKLSKVLPHVVIGASDSFVDKMCVPYHATSFIAAEAFSPNSGVYTFKLLGVKGGGVTILTGGSRKLGDNVFASLHRMLLGNNAIIVTVNNMMENHGQIWSWDFFGNHLKPDYPDIYDELLNLSKRLVKPDNFYFVISIRSFDSISKSGLLDFYKRNEIAMLDPKNKQKVIIMTNRSIYEYLSPIIKESELVSYLQTGGDNDDDNNNKFDMYEGLRVLRRNYGIKYLLNDGGRKMSESIRDEGLLAEERITLEPFNPATLGYTIDDSCILGKKGLGLDGYELKKALLLNSTKIESDEHANVYVYPLDESKVFDS